MSRWPHLALKDLVEFRKGTKVAVFDNEETSTVPYLGAAAIDTGRASHFARTRGAVVAQSTDVLMLWDGERSGLVTSGLEGVVASTVSRLRPKPGVDGSFLRYVLERQFWWIQSQRTGTGVPHVPKDLGRLLWIDLPGLDQQCKVAAVLDAIDNQILVQEKLAQKYDALRLGLVADLLAEADVEETVPLGSISEVASGVTLGYEASGPGTVSRPYLRVANVQDGRLDLTEIKYVRVRRSELRRFELADGDVLLNEGGDADKLGRGSVWRGQIAGCLHQNHVFRVRCSSHIDPDYLSLVAGSPLGKRYFMAASKQTTNLASINSTQIKAFPIPIRTIERQRAIAHSAQTIASAVEGARGEANKLRLLRVALADDLLTGRVFFSAEGSS